MKCVVTFLVIYSTCFTAAAQENFLKGFIIKNSKDTVSGLIDYRNWKNNPSKILFKENADAAVFTYLPHHIKAFSVADEYYESAKVEIEVSPEKINELTADPEFKIEYEDAFLQGIVYGEKSLYYLVNNKGKDNFYIKTGDRLELLLYKQYSRNVSYTRQVLINSKYIGQLSNYLNDCTELHVNLGTIKYSQKDLVKVLTAYYACKQNKPVYQKKRERFNTHFGVMGGVMATSLIMGRKTDLILSKAKYDNSFSLTGGLYFALILPRNRQRFSIQNELLLTSYNIDGYYLDYENDNDKTETTYTFKATHLKVNTLVRVKIPTPKFDLHFEAGISNAFAVSIAADQVQVVTFYAPPTTKKSEALNTRGYEQGLVAGVGAHYKKISLTGRFERGNGFSRAVALKTAINRFYFVVGYRLSK
jgi:hypothetical protein